MNVRYKQTKCVVNGNYLTTKLSKRLIQESGLELKNFIDSTIHLFVRKTDSIIVYRLRIVKTTNVKLTFILNDVEFENDLVNDIHFVSDDIYANELLHKYRNRDLNVINKNKYENVIVNATNDKEYIIDVAKPYEERWDEVILDYKAKYKLFLYKLNIYLSNAVPYLELKLIKMYISNILSKQDEYSNIDEVRGFAHKMDMSLITFMLALWSYELTAYCTSSVFKTPDGNKCFFRTLDWDFAELRNLVIKVKYINSHTNEVLCRGVTLVGYFGLLTVTKYINEHNYITAAINYRKLASNSTIGLLTNIKMFITTGKSSGYLLRDAFCGTNNIQEIIQTLQTTDLIAPVYFTVSSSDGDMIISRSRTSVDHVETINKCLRVKTFTPLRIENAQSASSSSLITAPFGGVLNERRCKALIQTNIDNFRDQPDDEDTMISNNRLEAATNAITSIKNTNNVSITDTEIFNEFKNAKSSIPTEFGSVRPIINIYKNVNDPDNLYSNYTAYATIFRPNVSDNYSLWRVKNNNYE